ncbi:DUF4233 domain-containing protein [Glutamicibacter sp. V16R2B1]|uniref:DUF4233 domain-containing protein n=1 Tax=Glutamicibacter sp. V16R2B1 TaxID=2036207 RepID=UPI0010FE90F7|nr:DUF4233 domain-containing protein [Glutamicibacter sp. V16R2B1]TLK50152.1 DUF4233 domain-containing protein [Glutamicibacter sp. V16R2B1]
MARLTKAQREWRPGMRKKPRSLKIILASSVLSLEAFVALFFTLATLGLKRSEVAPGLILGGGAVMIALCIITCAFLRKPFGIVMGWIIQLMFILCGFVLADMFYIGAAFAACWWYALYKGGQMDVENKRREAEQAEWERNNPPVES